MEGKPICFVPHRKFPEIYSGTPSFMGLPVIARKEDLAGNDVVFMGAPFEGVPTWGGFSGCELSPKSIRNVSVRYSGFLPETGYDVFDYLKAGDYGDSAVYAGDIERSLGAIHDKAAEIFAAGAVPVTFGGDHSVTIPVIRALSESGKGKIGVIHLDSHMDNMPSYGEERFARCSPLHRVYELDNVNPRNVVHLGMRGPRNDKVQMQVAMAHGCTVLSSFDVKIKGVEAAIARALEVAHDGTDAVYVTLCSDILDVAHNPGGPPDLCGLSSFEVAFILHKLAAAGIAGFDFVEIYPPQDPNRVSSHAATWMALYVLSGLARGRFGLTPRSIP